MTPHNPEVVFDLLEGLKRGLREIGRHDVSYDLAAGFARRTGGVDVRWIIEVLTRQMPSPFAALGNIDHVEISRVSDGRPVIHFTNGSEIVTDQPVLEQMWEALTALIREQRSEVQ